MFNIQPGPRSQKVVLAFEGASGIDPDQLDKIVDQQKLERQLFTDPIVVTELLERYYREQGFLAAEIDEPRYEYQDVDGASGARRSRGPEVHGEAAHRIGQHHLPDRPRRLAAAAVAGQPYVPAAAENALDKIRDLYWAKGYNDVRSDYALVQDRSTGQVDVSFTITEGRQSVIAGITIGGNDKVSNHLVQEQIQLVDAQPLDLSALARSRRNLYDTGAFSVVDITRRDVPESGSTDGVARARRRRSRSRSTCS